MKFFKFLCVIALIFSVSAISYAETQSVKISGSITERAFARSSYNLDSNGKEHDDGTESSRWETFLLSTVEVQVDAELTDNVSGVIRLVNQRVWGNNYYAYDHDTIVKDYNGREFERSRSGSDNSYAIEVDLAYIELKEFLYSPLTLRIGRQDLWFGRGFIVGANFQDPNDSIYPREYTAIKSFDAIRATLDYDPWTIDAVYAKIAENALRSDDDGNLMGVNVGYVFDKYNAEAEVYYWFYKSKNSGSAVGTSWSSSDGVVNNDIHTIGFRGSFDPIEDWTVALEAATQYGAYIGADNQRDKRYRFAYAVDAMVECRAFQKKFKWRPVLALEYILYSGEKNDGEADKDTTGNFGGWHPMFRGKGDTFIREYQGLFYSTSQDSSPAYTNQHQVLLKGTVEPMDSLKVDVTYANFWQAHKYSSKNKGSYIGSEFDFLATWDYTEDVSFSLVTSWFFPGNHFGDSQDDVATNVVGTIKLTF